MFEVVDMPRMSKTEASKRIGEAKNKIKKVYYEFNYPLTSGQNRMILDAIEKCDKVQAMFRKL
jgi:hypothetical protein